MTKTKKKKKDNLYLSDKPPLNTWGKIGLGISYLILILWAVIVLLPLAQMVISSFNGKLGKYISLGTGFEFSAEHYKYLFNNTYFTLWVKNTLVIAGSTAILTLIIVSLTGYAYSRFRFKGRKSILMAIMVIQVIPAFAGITAYFTLHAIISDVIPSFSRQAMLVLIYSAGGIASNTFILKAISTHLHGAG